MKHYTKTTLAMGAVGLLLLTACSNGEAASANDHGNPETTITWSHFSSEQSAIGQAGVAAKEYIEGQDVGLTVENHWSSSLVDPGEELASAASGLADIVQATFIYDPQILPAINWTSPLPGYMPEDAAGLASMIGTASMSEVVLGSEVVQDQYAEQDVVPLSVWVGDYMYLTCNEPITTLEEAEGKRVRSPGSLTGEEIEALGMVPVSVAANEQYEALQRGVVDCTPFYLELAADAGLYEVAPHIMAVPFTPSASPVLMNQGTYDGLSEDQIDALAGGMAAYHERTILAELEAGAEIFESGGQAEELGIEVHDAPDLQETLRSHRDQVVANMPEDEVDGLSSDEQTELLDSYNDFTTEMAETLNTAGFDTSSMSSGEDLVNQVLEAPNTEATQPFFDELEVLLQERINGIR